MGGDLNFSIGVAEILRVRAKANSLPVFFFHHLPSSNLIDLHHIRMKPTWRNHRVGDDRVEKHIYMFLIVNALMSHVNLLQHRVGVGGVLDHSHIILELKGNSPKLANPFKLNVEWLKDDSFLSLVK